MVLPGRRDGYFVTEGYVTDAKGDNIQAVQRERVANPTWLRQELEDLYRSVQAGEFTSDDLRDMAPEGPKWDYAENAFERLRKAYGDED